MPAPKEYQKDFIHLDFIHPWRAFNESCVLECPPGYSEKRISRSGSGERTNATFTCEKCNGKSNPFGLNSLLIDLTPDLSHTITITLK